MLTLERFCGSVHSHNYPSIRVNFDFISIFFSLFSLKNRSLCDKNAFPRGFPSLNWLHLFRKFRKVYSVAQTLLEKKSNKIPTQPIRPFVSCHLFTSHLVNYWIINSNSKSVRLDFLVLFIFRFSFFAFPSLSVETFFCCFFFRFVGVCSRLCSAWRCVARLRASHLFLARFISFSFCLSYVAPYPYVCYMQEKRGNCDGSGSTVNAYAPHTYTSTLDAYAVAQAWRRKLCDRNGMSETMRKSRWENRRKFLCSTARPMKLNNVRSWDEEKNDALKRRW